MSEEKKTDAVTGETATEKNTAEEKKPEEQPAVKPEEKESETEKKESAEDGKTETLKTANDKKPEEPSQASENRPETSQSQTGSNAVSGSSHPKAEHKTEGNDSHGTVPPVNEPQRQRKPEKQHHSIWKKVLMYVLVFLVAGCGAFAGSYAAQRVYHDQMQKEAVKEFGNFGNMTPFGGDNNETTSSGPALGITIQQTDDGIEIVGFASNGNAEKAGLKTGDIIKEVDGKSYDSVSAISSYISSKNVGDKVKVSVSRNGEEKTYSVKLVKKDVSSYSMPSAPSDGNSDSDDQNQPKALPGTDGENSQLQG